MKNYLIIALLLLGISCKESHKQVVNNKPTTAFNDTIFVSDKLKIDDLLVVEDKDKSSIFSINQPGVFFTQLTTKESDSIENLNPEAYEGISENANNRAAKAVDLLEKLKINNYWSDKRFVRYKTTNTEYLIDTRKRNLEEYCIIFQKDKKPSLIKVDSLNEKVLAAYFK